MMVPTSMPRRNDMDFRDGLEDTGEHDFSMILQDDLLEANARMGRVTNRGLDTDTPAARMASEQADAAGRELAQYRTEQRVATASGRIRKLFARYGLFDN